MTRLFSLSTKIRMGIELLLPPRPSQQDESVAALVERHFGREAVDRLADPLLSGIFGGDATQLSARTVLPKLVEMETEYGSLTRGMLAAHRAMRKRMAAKLNSAGTQSGTQPNPQPHTQSGSPPAGRPEARRTPRGIFTTLRGGMQQFVTALEANLEPGWVLRSTAVDALERTADQWDRYRREAGKTNLRFRHPGLARLGRRHPASGRRSHVGAANSPPSPTHRPSPSTCSMTKTRSAICPKASASSSPPAKAASCSPAPSSIANSWAAPPPGKVVLRAFLGGMQERSPHVPKATQRSWPLYAANSTQILGENNRPRRPARTHPGLALVSAQWLSTPSATVIASTASTNAWDELPGLKLAGNAYDGIGISDCIRLGRQAAKELLEVGTQQNVG